MMAALFGEAGVVGAILGALASVLGAWLAARGRERDLAAAAKAEADNSALREALDASRGAEAIHQGVRDGGYHDAVDRL